MEEVYRKLGEDEKKKVEETIAKILSKYKFIDAALIFGSFVTRKFFRDIDVAIVCEKVREKDLERIALEIEKKIKIPVDLKVLDELPLKLKFFVIRQGKLVMVNQKERYFIVKHSVITQFLDFKPFLERYTKGVLGWS
ncbi:MAG: nucleotidyltransferase domain-containing protein [Candidatus Aenigmarchaeota archaeon]|nr:nucleotidyltransferase domain-containing protein [Candidatus Aenigmarchaeota archaeon]